MLGHLPPVYASLQIRLGLVAEVYVYEMYTVYVYVESSSNFKRYKKKGRKLLKRYNFHKIGYRTSV